MRIFMRGALAFVGLACLAGGAGLAANGDLLLGALILAVGCGTLWLAVR